MSLSLIIGYFYLFGIGLVLSSFSLFVFLLAVRCRGWGLCLLCFRILGARGFIVRLRGFLFLSYRRFFIWTSLLEESLLISYQQVCSTLVYSNFNLVFIFSILKASALLVCQFMETSYSPQTAPKHFYYFSFP